MSIARGALVLTLALALGLAACGRKGDPVRPGKAAAEKTQTQTTQ